jgi:hypothetical protein
MNAEKIKERFTFYLTNNTGLYPPSTKAHGVYVGALNKACKGDANRKLVLKYLTGKTSTKVLSDTEWIALRKMIDVSPVELETMCGIILGAVVKQEGQGDMFSGLEVIDCSMPAPTSKDDNARYYGQADAV